MVYAMVSKTIESNLLWVRLPPRPPMRKAELSENDLRRIFKTQTPASRVLRAVWRAALFVASFAVLFMVFFVALNYSAYIKRFEYSVSPPVVQTPVVATPTPNQPLPNYSPELTISKIGLDVPIVMNIGINDVIPNLANGVVQLANSATPGQNGNVVIFGHSSDYPWSTGHYKNVFALLDKLSTGDNITVAYGSQQFVYTVTGSKVVKPTDISVVNKTDASTLTLITCYPVGTATNRLVITAALTSGTVTGTQTDNPLTQSLPTSR